MSRAAPSAYRYALARPLGDGATVTFVMLNPSTADATTDDPTIRRCIRFATTWGFGRLEVVNLYALRATDPAELWCAADPVGPDNDTHLARAMATADLVVAAWGARRPPGHAERVDLVLGRASVHCLGRNRDGSPRHPLYVPAGTPPTPWARVRTSFDAAFAD